MSERMNQQIDIQLWIRNFNMNGRDAFIDLNDPECYDRILFVDPETKNAFCLPEEAKSMEPETVAQMMLSKMQEGVALYVCPHAEKMPRKVTLNAMGMPSIDANQVKEPAAAPVEPKKPNLWKRFANTLTGGRAYKEDFTRYERDMNTYRSQLDAHMKEADEYALALPAINLREGLSAETMAQENAYKKEKAAAIVFEDAKVRKNELTGANEIGKNTYEQLFAPAAQPPEHIHNGKAIADTVYNYPNGMTRQQVTALAFACTLSDEALSDIQWTSSTVLPTQQDMQQAKIKNQRVMLMENFLVDPNDTRHAGLTDAVINGRNMMTGLSEQYEQGNPEPMGRVLNNAVVSLVQNWRCATKLDVTRNVAIYGYALENLKACLEIPGLKEAANIDPDVLRQMDAAIEINRLQQRAVSASADLMLMYVTFGDNYREQRNLLTEQVIAKKLLDAEFARQHSELSESVREEKMRIAIQDPTRLSEAMDDFVAWQENRPILPLEEQLLENPGKVMAEYRAKARQSSLYQEMCRIDDPTEFRREAMDLVSSRNHAQLFCEQITVNELGSRNNQPQPDMQRTARERARENQPQMHNN